MEYIIASISLSRLIQDSVALLISFLVGFFIWLIQQSYSEYKQEIKALKKVEICLSHDLAANTNNQEYLKKWKDALEKNNLFSVAFTEYSLNTTEFFYVKNFNLINRLNALSFSLNGLYKDLKNIYDTYTSNSFKLLDKNLVKEWEDMNKNINFQSDKLSKNFVDSEKEIKEVVANLRVYYKQKKFSLFWLFNLLSFNIYPKSTDKKVQKEILELNKNLEDKAKLREVQKVFDFQDHT